MIGKDVPLRDMVKALELAYEQHAPLRKAVQPTFPVEESGLWFGRLAWPQPFCHRPPTLMLHALLIVHVL